QLFYRRNAVLVLPAHRSAHNIARPRFERDRGDFPAFDRLKAHPAGARERDTDHDFELRHVAMPSNRRSGRIFSDDSLCEFFGGNICQLCRLAARWKKKDRNGISRGSLALVKVIMKAEFDDPAPRPKSMKIECSKLELSDGLQQCALLGLGEQRWEVEKAFR